MHAPRALRFAFLRRVVIGCALGGLAWASEPGPGPINLEQSRAYALFKEDIEPLLLRETGGKTCSDCHEPGGTSQLILRDQPKEDFYALLNGDYLFLDGPDTLLARVTTHDAKKRMPKGKKAEPWSAEEIGKLRAFLGALNEVVKIDGKADEQFPGMLRTAYSGSAPSSLDNQFLTYRQLRGKIRTLFGDDWVRNGEDLFEKNVTAFGGADFKQRFNENSKATASFLSGLEMLSNDVAERAYSQKSGPFAGRAENLPELNDSGPLPGAYGNEISRLYRALLFRSPTPGETKEAAELIRGIHGARDEILAGDYELGLELSVEDPVTGLKSQRQIRLPVSGEFHGLYQELIDEGVENKRTLGRKFVFKKGDDGQRFRVSNVDTFGNVSLIGLELRRTGSEELISLPVSGPEVQADGAWKVGDEQGTTFYDDGNEEKGSSNIVIPIAVPEDGEYELSVRWHKNARNAHTVLMEVFSGGGNTLALPPAPIAPEPGQAQFVYDSSADNVPYVELPGRFRFGPGDLVEIRNQETRDRVTASALRFVPDPGGQEFLIDSKEAEGQEAWLTFDPGKFKSYNKVGTPLHDDGKEKGARFLRFKPESKQAGGWKPETFYRVQVNFPGKAGNEQRVPISIRAQESSPIIQVRMPARARGDAEVVLDASKSYTVQGSPLKFEWRQIAGPPVRIEQSGPVLKLVAPRRAVQQAAWVALCRALMRHPDFIFTRPPSLEWETDPGERRRLQLVKLALDLTGRPPTAKELETLGKGASWEAMVDGYLAGEEFKDFYFHRIRLYLESHGTAQQDEPARLWCYIAFNDLPIQQLLTADYSADAQFVKIARPAYHGRTGVLTTKGFLEGKPGLPHFNYAAQVAMLFLGYVFEVPPEVVEQREGSTAASTVDPNGICYGCHKVLTPLAMQRNQWTDEGRFRTHDEYGLPIEASDSKLVEGYPFAGEGLEAFATQAVKKERFLRTLIDTHFTFYFGRQMRWREDERELYRRTWEALKANHYSVRSLIRSLVTAPQYIEGRSLAASQNP